MGNHVQLRDLGGAPAIDPFDVQPGAILLDRFCVIGRVRHAKRSWRVPVTDLERELGDEPHHRLLLHHVAADRADHALIRLAVGAHQLDARRIRAVVAADDGLLLLASGADGQPLLAPLGADHALAVGRSLATILTELHANGLMGVHFDLRDLRIDHDGVLQFSSLNHLVGVSGAATPGPVRADVESLVARLRTLDDDALNSALEPPPAAAADLLARLRPLRPTPGTQRAADVLPADAPFLERPGPFGTALGVVRNARHAGPTGVVFTSPVGHGKSCLLRDVARELIPAGVRLLVVDAATGHGVDGVAHQVVALMASLSAPDREAVRVRMLRALGPMAGLVPHVSEALGVPVAQLGRLPDLGIEENGIRTAAVMADLLAAVGVRGAPLVLVLDNAEVADKGVRDLLYQLLTPGRSHHTAILAACSGAPDLELPNSLPTCELAAFDVDEVCAVVTAALPGPLEAPEHVARTLHDRTGGVALTVWNTLRRWVEHGDLFQVDGHWRLGPLADDGVIDLTRWTVKRLDEDSRWLALLLAVTDAPRPLEWLQQVSRFTPARTAGALTDLLRSGLVARRAGGVFAMHHATIRDRFLDDLGRDQAILAHRAIHRWCVRTEADIVQRATHGEHATPEGRSARLAAAHLDAAQHLLAVQDTGRASWHIECAWRRGPADDDRYRACELRGDVLLLAGDIDRAVQSYVEAFATPQDPLQPLRTANRVAMALFKRGSAERCRELCEAALAPHGLGLPRSRAGLAVAVAVAVVRVVLGLNPAEGELADQLTLLHTYLVAILAPTHPLLGLLCILRGRAYSLRRHTGASARGRAFFSVLLASRRTAPRMRTLLADALADAESSDDPFEVGVVHHFRAQCEFELGHHELGQTAAAEALAAFHRAGDLSIAVNTMAISAFHDLDRQSAPVMSARLDRGESAAWRQHNEALVPAFRAMRLWVRTRRGDDTTAAALDLAGELEPTPRDQLTDLMTVSLLARVLAWRGQVDVAVDLAQQAIALRTGMFVAPGFTDVAYLAHAEAQLALAERDGAGPVLAKALRQVRRAAKPGGHIEASARLCLGRGAQLRGELAEARTAYAATVECADTSGEVWLRLLAHQELAALDAGRDILRAGAHAERARELRGLLGCASVDPPVAAPPTRPAPEPVESPQGSSRVSRMLAGLEEPLARALGPDRVLSVHVAPKLPDLPRLDALDLLVVNMVLLARDAASSDEGPITLTASAEALPDSGGDAPGVVIRVQAPGHAATVSGGAVDNCRDIASDLDATFEVRPAGPSFELWATLASGPPRGRAHPHPVVTVGVYHPDERVRRTLIQGAAEIGFAAQELTALETLPLDLRAVFVPPEGLIEGLPLPQIVVVPRREGRRPDGLAHPLLMFPFLVDDLRKVLVQVTGEDPQS